MVSSNPFTDSGMDHPFGFDAETDVPKPSPRHTDAFLEAHRSGEFTPSELLLLHWQLGLASGFKTALMNAISKADSGNLDRLEQAFPDEVIAFRSWIGGDLAQRFRKLGIDV